MSSLETFQHPLEDAIVSLNGNLQGVHLPPGDWVRHKHRTGSMGILIANGDDFLVVLWSKRSNFEVINESGYVFAPYVPLIVTSTIFVPKDFTPKDPLEGFKLTGFARYSKKSICKEFFGNVDISDIFKNSITPITGSKP